MNLADDMRANKKAAAAAAAEQKTNNGAAARFFVSELDKYVPEIADALREARVKKDWNPGSRILERGWTCSAVAYDAKGLVIFPSGKWCFGDRNGYSKMTRGSILLVNKPSHHFDSRNIQARLHAWTKGQG